MDEEKIKSSFEKVKKDIAFLAEQIADIKTSMESIKANFMNNSSIGNKGVPTDRQTDRQTADRFSANSDGVSPMPQSIPTDIPTQTPTHPQHSNTKVQQMADLTEMVTTLKNDLQKRFKELTKQEFYIFSVLFTVDKSQNITTYKDVSLKTGLSESSVRDYIQKIIKKGIPIEKEKINNKLTTLKIPPEIRNLATLDNLLRLRNQLPDSSLDKFNS